jgi:hypothetical protein
MNGLRKCGIYTQWNFTYSQRKMKLCHLQVNVWNWRTPSSEKLVSKEGQILHILPHMWNIILMQMQQ